MAASDRLALPWLAQILRDEAHAFLCGAGISVDSGVPDAACFVEQLISALFVAAKDVPPPERTLLTSALDIEDPGLDEDLRCKLVQSRLEYVLQVASQTPGIDPVACLAALDRGRPNPLHYLLAICASSRGARQPGILLTTNFECLLEDAFGELRLATPQILVGPAIEERPASGSSILIKLHGSLRTARGRNGSLTATIDQVGQSFPDATVALLDDLLHDRTLIVLGYSGNDHYDVIPYLVRHRFARIIWINHDPGVESGQIWQCRPPMPLKPLFQGPRDVFIHASTPSLVQPLQEALGLSCGPQSVKVNDWQKALDRWVADLGPRALLLLADLVVREDRFLSATQLNRNALKQLSASEDADARAKARRNIALSYTRTSQHIFAVAELKDAMQEEMVGPEQRSALFIELGIARNSLSWGTKTYYPETGKWKFGITAEQALEPYRIAEDLAREANSERLLALARQNLGIVYWNMAKDGGWEDRGGPGRAQAIILATIWFERARAVLHESHRLETLRSNSNRLGECYLASSRFVDAARMFLEGAWYSRILAYRDEGELLRLQLAKASSAMALANTDRPFAWMTGWLRRLAGKGSVADGRSVGYRHAQAAEFLEDPKLRSLEAVEVMKRCLDEARTQQRTWVRSGDVFQLVDLVRAQARELAQGPLARWSFRS